MELCIKAKSVIQSSTGKDLSKLILRETYMKDCLVGVLHYRIPKVTRYRQESSSRARRDEMNNPGVNFWRVCFLPI